jgi:hypothetical protein
MFFFQGEKQNMSVRDDSGDRILGGALVDKSTLVDFLAVRKIPIRRHPFIQAGGVLATEVSSEPESEDPAVESFLSQIRETVLTDRALHDKVQILSSTKTA